MQKHVSHAKPLSDNSLLALSIVVMLLVAISCAGGAKSDASSDSSPESEDFHADNDIAMTIRSIADAIKVGEPLDSTEYDFLGVLTDGQGAPLYTDVQGSPGVWVVDVLDKRNATIRNLYLGDLLPDDLQSYILQSLSLTGKSPVDFENDDAESYDDTSIVVYDFGGGYLRFEIRAGIAPNGLEGPLLTIILSADAPPGLKEKGQRA